MLKGPKRSFVVVVVVEKQKCAREQKRASVAHYGIELSCLPCLALCGLVVVFHRHNLAGIV